MDKTKETIKKLTSTHGQHTTEVTEHYKPAVVHEQINPTREQVDTTVIDNEVHQDHHHTSVLPVKDRKVLPTEHIHNMAAAKHTEFQHGDHEALKTNLAAEAARFKDETKTAATEKTHTVAPTVTGEHHHHHVHETIQPVIQKETIQPSVVHTTIPVHEVHHNEPKHYTASALPAISMEEFKRQGGSLTGLADRTERFEGEPENIAKTGLVSGHANHGSRLAETNKANATTTTASNQKTTGTTATTGKATVGTGMETSRAQKAIDSRVDRASNASTTGMSTRSSMASAKNDLTNTSSYSSVESKPSLLQKLNPFKDADGDGKKGIMT